MSKIEIEIPDIPHGHGLSFKKGLADALLNAREHEVGITLKREIGKHVKT